MGVAQPKYVKHKASLPLMATFENFEGTDLITGLSALKTQPVNFGAIIR